MSATDEIQHCVESQDEGLRKIIAVQIVNNELLFIFVICKVI